MLFTFINLSILSFVIFGFASLKNKLFNKNIKIFNQDFIIGVIIISSIAILSNFFFPLKFITPIIFFFGITLFLINLIKKSYEINFSSYLLILFLFCFFTHNNSLNYDSPFYHIQIIKWISEYKISLGLVNLEPRYGMPSIWHQFISLFSYNILNFNPIYLISLVLFSLFLNQVFDEKNFKKISSIYLFFVNFFLIFFALIHPFGDGIIFNHLGSPETDIIGIVFFSYSFYFFLKILENKKINDFYYLCFFCFYGMLTKISYIYLCFLLVVSIFFFKEKIFKEKKILIFLSFIFILWGIRNIFISGCFIFPISFTCFDFYWAKSSSEIESFTNMIKSFNRDTRLREKYMDFEFTLNSYKWFIPWFKDYFLNTSILKILSLSFFTSVIFIIYGKIYKRFYFNDIFNYKNILVFIFVLFGILIWFQAPEVRFAHGLIILLIFINFIFILNILNLKMDNFKYYLNKLLISILILLCIKNFDVIRIINKIFIHEFDYSNIVEIKNINGNQIFSANTQHNNSSSDISTFCLDFKKICLFDVSNLNHLKISKNKFSYLVFYN